MGKDYYNILGVDKNSSQEEIKKAFRQKAHQYHPDKAGGDEAKFKEVNEAYQVLGNAQKKAQYDQYGSAFEHAQNRGGFGGFEGFRDFSGYSSGFNVNMDDLGDIFGGLGDIFGFGGSGGRQKQARGNDIQAVLAIDFIESAFGAEKQINLKKKVKCGRCHGNAAEPGTKIETCKVCGGSGRVVKTQRTILGAMQVRAVCDNCGGEGKTYAQKCRQCGGTGVVYENASLDIKIPAGIDDGESIRLSGQGEAGEKGAPPGDLYIKIKVREHPLFHREGYDVYSKAKIKIYQAAAGGKIEVETVHGSVKLKIPAGTQSGAMFKLRNKGIPRLRGGGFGSHFVQVKVDIPSNLNRKQKDILRDLDI